MHIIDVRIYPSFYQGFGLIKIARNQLSLTPGVGPLLLWVIARDLPRDSVCSKAEPLLLASQLVPFDHLKSLISYIVSRSCKMRNLISPVVVGLEVDGSVADY